MRIVIVSQFFSAGMGYSENCLSRALARRGHEVHVVTSTLNAYGNEPALYDATYAEFLGPRSVEPGTFEIDGFKVHRLPTSLVAGYVRMQGLVRTVSDLKPDVVHALEIASIEAMQLALPAWSGAFALFAETHQTMTVVKPYLKEPRGPWLPRAKYWATRTLPISLASTAVEKCYAVTPDCGEVAIRFYGVPGRKIAYLSLGADVDTFHPVETDADATDREALRAELGVAEHEILCLYSGRFTEAKNPLLLARAVERLQVDGKPYRAIFIGNGEQREAISRCRGAIVRSFMKHADLARFYRAADICVWPRQETISMVDAASSGVPLVISDRIGERARIEGNGESYPENDVEGLVRALLRLEDPALRRAYGAEGRAKALRNFSWPEFARTLEEDFARTLERRRAS